MTGSTRDGCNRGHVVVLYVLTNLSQRGYKDPESDDEGNLHPLKLHVEHVILRSVSMMTSMTSIVSQLLQGILTTVFK